MCQGFNHFSGFFALFCIGQIWAKLANISVRVKLISTHFFVKWSDRALLEMARVASFGRNLKEPQEIYWSVCTMQKLYTKKIISNF